MLLEYRQNYTLRNNSSSGKELIYPLGNRGFFSEVNNLALAILYCLENGIQIQLYSKKWVSGNWNDYFNPIIKEYRGFIPVPIDLYVETRKDKYFKFYHKSLKNRFILQENIWNEMRNEQFTNKHFHYPELGIKGTIFEAKKQILNLILDFNTETSIEVRNIDPQSLKSNKKSCGIHIRRGDKVTGKSKEAESFTLETYVSKALQINPNITTFSICTDDYEVVEVFKKNYPQFKIISFCPPSRKGYFQKEYNSKVKKQEKRNEVINILKDCELLINSEIFIGTFSSNVARYVVLMRNNQDCYSLDSSWSPR